MVDKVLSALAYEVMAANPGHSYAYDFRNLRAWIYIKIDE